MMKTSTDPPAFRVRPAQPEEAGAFFAQTPEQDAQMGAIGHVLSLIHILTWVKVTEIDEKGRVNLSRKDALKELAAAADKK